MVMGWESCDVLIFDLGPLLQGQMSLAQLNSAYTSYYWPKRFTV